ncbi:ABC transporter permease [Acidisoma sp. L85]|uniref:ABC transporter permease n=1 Tax=Acidisoma sp. L85 TaxID=1641850 RepID=UPI00131BE795|nr:ABC transporter permease [Acidisoma sp. L85]
MSRQAEPPYELNDPLQWHSKKRSKIRLSWSVIVSGGIILLITLVAISASFIVPFDPNQIGVGQRLTAPGMDFFLGTDEFGRDVLSRMIFGARITLCVGVSAVGIGFACGVVVGAVAAYVGGWLGEILMRSVDLLYTFPDVLIALGLVAFLGPSFTNAVIAVGLSAIPYYARSTYGAVLSERQKPYVLAARLIGASHARVVGRHLLPNVLPTTIVLASLGFSSAVLAAASLSFLGLGAQPPTPEWGLMLSEGRDYITRAPWLVVIPGLSVFVTVVAFNVFGDGIRDLFDLKENRAIASRRFFYGSLRRPPRPIP